MCCAVDQCTYHTFRSETWWDSRLLGNSSQMKAKITFSPSTYVCVPLNDEYWFDALCSTNCTLSMIINSLRAISTISLAHSPVTSCRGQFWASRGNNWDNYSWMETKNNNTCIMLLRCGVIVRIHCDVVGTTCSVMIYWLLSL